MVDRCEGRNGTVMSARGGRAPIGFKLSQWRAFRCVEEAEDSSLTTSRRALGRHAVLWCLLWGFVVCRSSSADPLSTG